VKTSSGALLVMRKAPPRVKDRETGVVAINIFPFRASAE
jgi:hypothetical protein